METPAELATVASVGRLAVGGIEVLSPHVHWRCQLPVVADHPDAAGQPYRDGAGNVGRRRADE
jgi:hypothetical protein